MPATQFYSNQKVGSYRPVKDDAQNPLNNIQLSFSGAFKQAGFSHLEE